MRDVHILESPDCAVAYCGPAHGQTWTHPDTADWPPEIMLSSGGLEYPYRLIHDVRARRLARDHSGNVLYVAVNP
jgi:hypothetical protein